MTPDPHHHPPDDLCALIEAVLDHGLHPATDATHGRLQDGAPWLRCTYPDRGPLTYTLAEDGGLVAHDYYPGNGAVSRRALDGDVLGAEWTTPAGDPADN